MSSLSTDVLVHRLRRAAKAIDNVSEGDPQWQAYANTCRYAADRLQDLDHSLRNAVSFPNADSPVSRNMGGMQTAEPDPDPQP